VRTACISFVWSACISFLTIWVICSTSPAWAQSDAPALFSPLLNNTIRDETPAQAQKLNQIRSRPTTEDVVSLLRLNLAALQSKRALLSMPNGAALTFSRQSFDAADRQNFTWSGSLPGVKGDATIVVHNGNATGTVRSDENLYRIEPVGNGVHALVKVNEGRFPPEHPPSFQELEKRGDVGPILPSSNRADRKTGPTQINVLVGYTPKAANAVSDIIATITLAVAEANTSYRNSGVNINLKLTGTMSTDQYDEDGKTLERILADFVQDDKIRLKRKNVLADLVAVIIDNSEACGLADAIMATASTAFAIVYYDCATGYYSLAHELGHLMGARHDEQDDPSVQPYAYGHGFRHDASPTWRTIMAYDCTVQNGCPRLQFWSNPRVNKEQDPMGTVDRNDNARVLNQTAATVARFKTQLP
jgi:hypothetical protein